MGCFDRFELMTYARWKCKKNIKIFKGGNEKFFKQQSNAKHICILEYRLQCTFYENT